MKQKLGLKIATRVFAVSASEGARQAKMQVAQAGELVSRDLPCASFSVAGF